MIKVKVANQQSALEIPSGQIREIVRAVLEEEGVRNAEISVAFVDNPTSRELNNKYLQHDYPTDVLSFPLSEPGERELSGELVIGAEVALDEAEERGHDVQAELALYVIHGLLHLCGEEDKTPEGAERMRESERYYLEEFGYPDITHGKEDE